MKIVTVIPLKKGIFKDDLTYFTNKEIHIGDIVEIKIRKKGVLGLVTKIQDASSAKAELKNISFNLKKIENIKKDSFFTKEFWDSALLANQYFAQSGSGILPHLIPSFLIEEYDKISNFEDQTKNFLKENNNTKIEKLIFQAPLEERISYYKTLIRSSFAQKKSVFVVLPTENDLDLFFSDLSKGIENFSFLLHSNTTIKKNTEKAKKIMGSSHPVLVLGTAPFLSLPRRDLGTIIVEKESSSAYKTIAKPNFDLRIFTEIFASKSGVRLIFADSLVRFETMHRKENGDFSLVRSMSFKVNFDGEMEIEKISKENLGKYFIFTEKTIKKIVESLVKKRKVFIFALRKGLATMTICRDCGETMMCERCSSPVVLYLSKDGKKRMFVCNRCGKERPSESVCDNCRSWNLSPYGIGTDTALEELKEILSLFAKDLKLFKIDKESVKNTKEAQKIIDEFERQESAILVGTEMALFYLKEKVHTSVVASFDSLWSIPNFRISEKAIKILLSILDKTSKNLIVQTRNPESRALDAMERDDLATFAREELRDRKSMGYPPFVRFIKISCLSSKESVATVKKMLLGKFARYEPDIFSGFISKIKNQYKTNMIIRVDPFKWSCPDITPNATIDEELFSAITSLPPEFIVSVDPEDFL